jgi:ankyrin repeat protein
MKILKNYEDFLNEELKILKGPSDEETFNMNPLKRVELVNSGELDKKFYPSEEEIFRETNQKDFFESVFANNLLDVKVAIDRGADINKIMDECERTALMIASQDKQLEMVKLLVENGANINIENEYNYSALMYAIYSGKLKIVKYLVEHGADINIKGIDNYKPLSLASHYGNLDIVKYLIEVNKDNYTNIDYKEALGEAQGYEGEKIREILKSMMN